MQYRVVPSLWPYGGRTFRRGEIFDEGVWGVNVASFIRVGLIEPVGIVGTKKDLVLQAREAGVSIPKGSSKQDIIELIEEESRNGI